jgi:dipeptidyl-peptidase 4
VPAVYQRLLPPATVTFGVDPKSRQQRNRRATARAIYHVFHGFIPGGRKQPLMNWKRLPRLVSNVIPVAAILSWVAIGLSSLTQTGLAQSGRIYTSDDYSRAANLLNAGTISLVDHAVERATFIGDDRFWYLDSEHGLPTLMVADAARRTKSAAYDQIRMAAALHAAGLDETDAKRIRPQEFDLLDEGRSARITISGIRYRCALGAAYRCSVELAGPPGTPKPSLNDASLADFSPDGKRAVFLRDWNLWVREIATGAEKQITTDGVKDYGYATDNAGWIHSEHAIVVWSPDSKMLATFQQDQRKTGEMYTVSSRIGHPHLETWKYPLIGDKDVTMIERVIIDVDSAKTTRLKMPPDQHRSTLCDNLVCQAGWEDVQWAADGKTLAFVSTSRDHKKETVRIANVVTGAVRDVFTESVPTFFDSGYDHVNWRYLSQRNEILWFSQRENWGNLYLYDADTGKLKHAVTQGNWNVDEVLHVNQETGDMILTGTGREPSEDPYYRRVYGANLDGKHLKLLTAEDADHAATVSGDGKFIIDIYSTPQKPQVMLLRDGSGQMIEELAHGDITRLQAAGWVAPETFRVKGHDGKTDVYGLLFRPANLDPSLKYPIIDYIYPGPQEGSFGTHGFEASRMDSNALAQLGFAVVQIEGMGNPRRSKAFQDEYLNDIGINAIPDQISGIRELAQRYPWIDLDRVGMWGHSGGGNATVATMLRYPDFVKVGIAESGNHENRNYEDDWDEKWVGLLQTKADGTTNYDSQANARYAANLKGKLMLAHGMLDDNVPVSTTLLLIDALEKANKDFALVVFPQAHHGYGDVSAYMMRRRWDYFITELMQATPPHEFAMPALLPHH